MGPESVSGNCLLAEDNDHKGDWDPQGEGESPESSGRELKQNLVHCHFPATHSVKFRRFFGPFRDPRVVQWPLFGQ